METKLYWRINAMLTTGLYIGECARPYKLSHKDPQTLALSSPSALYTARPTVATLFILKEAPMPAPQDFKDSYADEIKDLSSAKVR